MKFSIIWVLVAFVFHQVNLKKNYNQNLVSFRKFTWVKTVLFLTSVKKEYLTYILIWLPMAASFSGHYFI
jgi:hypothetical protein